MSEHALEFEMTIAARPETVFSLFVDHAAFAEWMGAQMGVATIDPHVGGAVRVDYGGGWKIASGEVLVLDAPERLSFSWGYEDGVPFAAGSTRVDITLRAEGSGTLLTLRHSGLPSEVAAREHESGWRLYTGILADRSAKAAHAESIDAVLRAWFAAWGADEADIRRAHVATCLADDGVFHHTTALAVGHAQLDASIASSRRHMQGLTLEPNGPHEQVHQHVRFPWKITRHAEDGTATTVATGENVATLAADGRMQSVVGFTNCAAAG